jgi:hypothetical protein
MVAHPAGGTVSRQCGRQGIKTIQNSVIAEQNVSRNVPRQCWQAGSEQVRQAGSRSRYKRQATQQAWWQAVTQTAGCRGTQAPAHYTDKPGRHQQVTCMNPGTQKSKTNKCRQAEFSVMQNQAAAGAGTSSRG